MLADVGLDFLGRGQGDILATAQTTAEFAVVHRQKSEGRFCNICGLAILLDLLQQRIFLGYHRFVLALVFQPMDVRLTGFGQI